jgi:hypothetical protein
MPLNFPSNPVLNDTYILGDKKWIFDGKGWKLYSASFELVPQVYNHANGAFDKANSANVLAQAAFDQANTDVTSISTTAGTYGNNTIVPVIVLEANGRVNSITNTTITFPVTDVGGNTGVVTNQNLLDSIKQVDGSGSGLDADLFDGLESSSFANSIYTLSAFNKANSANFLAQAAFDSGNTTLIYTTSAYGHANAAYDEANSSSTHADAAYNKANSANILAQAAYDFANTRYSSDGGTIDGDVIITGNLNITGNVISHSADDFIVNDPIILLANNNVGNVIDIGFVAHYEDGGANTKHTGLVRDVSTNTWYLFESYVPHIQENNILNIADPTLVISTLKANIDSQSVIVRGQDVLNRTNAAFDKANTDVTSISTTAGVYGNNTIVPVITLEANGRIRSITNVSISGIGGGTATLTWIKKTADYTANVGDRIIADTIGGSFIVTLPATPTVGSSVTLADGNNWYNNNLTVARNGSTIEGLAEDLILDIEGVQVDFIYDGTTWEVFSFSGPSPFPSPTGNTGRLLTTDGNITSWSVITESYVNASFGHANAAYVKANTANVYTSAAYAHANSAYGKANSAYNAANSISGIVAATPNTLVQRDSFGDIYANNLYANNLVSTSDIRFKNDIQNIDNPIDILNKLNAVSFKWINTDTKSYGLIAQELEKVLPELVSTTNDVKSVMYIPIIAILIEAIKQQQKEIDEIRNGKT